MTVAVREAEPGDRATLARLLADYLFEFDGRTGPYPGLDAYWTAPDRLPFLIESGGETIGLCLVRIVGARWRIAELAVVAGRRRSGIGRTAVEALAARAGAAGAAQLEAKVHPANAAVLPFWLAAGFRVAEAPGVIVTRRSLADGVP